MKVIHTHTYLNGLKVWFLYEYEPIIRQRLIQYKELNDIELQSIFLERMIVWIRQKFSHRIFIPAPSSQEDNRRRGFSHLETMLNYFELRNYPHIQKKFHFKQSELSQEDRFGIQQKLVIMNGNLLTHQHVVLFDDVMTTGSTLSAMAELIQPFHPRSLEALVIAKNPKNSFWK